MSYLGELDAMRYQQQFDMNYERHMMERERMAQGRRMYYHDSNCFFGGSGQEAVLAPKPPISKTFRDKLQSEIDEWLRGI